MIEGAALIFISAVAIDHDVSAEGVLAVWRRSERG